jgi:NADPH-dependent 2,4-dienoyl-CoA reductase/sulfur reductase-like enzyme
MSRADQAKPTSCGYTGPRDLAEIHKVGRPRHENVVSEQLQVAIVGGGIGGLTAALALPARGLEVAIFEQAVELGGIGAGISIHANAALLLRRIGLTDSIKKIGVPIAASCF